MCPSYRKPYSCYRNLYSFSDISCQVKLSKPKTKPKLSFLVEIEPGYWNFLDNFKTVLTSCSWSRVSYDFYSKEALRFAQGCTCCCGGYMNRQFIRYAGTRHLLMILYTKENWPHYHSANHHVTWNFCLKSVKLS